MLQTALLRHVCIANEGLAKSVDNDGDYEHVVAVCCVVCLCGVLSLKPVVGQPSVGPPIDAALLTGRAGIPRLC
jgi:hypothetical protein